MIVAVPIFITAIVAFLAGAFLPAPYCTCAAKPAAKLPVMTARKRRVWMRERLDINPALRGRR